MTEKRNQTTAALSETTGQEVVINAAVDSNGNQLQRTFEYSTRSNGIEKSISDEREFLSFHLENGLKVLVVSDPSCDKAGAGLSVGVGHFADEFDLPGLAHFLEHMVFMGTKKFPDENDYSAFLAKCGGSSSKY